EYNEHNSKFHIQHSQSECDVKEYMNLKTKYYHKVLLKKHKLDILFQFLQQRGRLRQFLINNPKYLQRYNDLFTELYEIKQYILSYKLINKDIHSIQDHIL